MKLIRPPDVVVLNQIACERGPLPLSGLVICVVVETKEPVVPGKETAVEPSDEGPDTPVVSAPFA